MNAPPWCQAWSGTPFDLLNPLEEQVNLVDVAVSLSRLPRYNGHTILAPLSVAQHSMLVAEIVRHEKLGPELELEALLHDAGEAYYGDITSPVIMALRELGGGPAWDELRRRVDGVVRRRFGLLEEVPSAVKRADLQALAAEQRFRMAPCARSWGLAFSPPPWVLDVRPMHEADVCQAFITQLAQLGVTS